MLPGLLQSNLASSRVPRRWKIKITQALLTLLICKTPPLSLPPKDSPVVPEPQASSSAQPNINLSSTHWRSLVAVPWEWVWGWQKTHGCLNGNSLHLHKQTLSRNIWKEDLLLILNRVSDFLRKIMFNSKYTLGHFSSRQVVLRSTETLSSANN